MLLIQLVLNAATKFMLQNYPGCEDRSVFFFTLIILAKNENNFSGRLFWQYP
jgi:hypothetical protein